MSSNQISYAIGHRRADKTALIKKAVEWIETNGHRIVRVEPTMFGSKFVINEHVVNEFKNYLEKC